MIFRVRAMRRVLLWFILITLFSVSGAGAEETVQGTAVDVDRQNGRFRIVETDNMNVVTVVSDPRRLPPGVVKGALIRAWGKFRRGTPVQFRAEKISVLSPPGRGDDPTGVRSRLFRGKGKKPF
jgi:hypothetical protein